MRICFGLNASLIVAVSLAVALPASAQTITNQQGLASSDGKNWDLQRLRVCYNFTTANSASSTLAFRQRVMVALSETWARHSPLSFFDVGPCSETTNGVHVSFTTEGSSANAGMFKGQKGYVTFNPEASNGTIVHEFGHVLNFTHSQAREDNPNWCITDLGNSPHTHPSRELTAYDPDSIMNYCRTQDYWIGHLSPLDIQGLQMVYGVNPDLKLGANEAGDYFGYGLAAGDYDGDGFADVVAGAPHEELRGQRLAGAGFAYRGNAVGALRPAQLLTQDGMGDTEPEDRLGWLAAMGDLDGDGIDEVILTAPFEKPGSDPKFRGAIFAYKWDGTTLAPLGSYAPPAQSDLEFLGLYDMLAADIDGDDRDELYVLAQKDGSEVVLPLRWNVDRDRFDALPTLDGLSGGATSLTAAELSVSPGLELVVGFGGGELAGSPRRSGYVQVLQIDPDGAGGFNAPRVILQIAQTAGANPEAGDAFGSVVAVADFDGDGRVDLAVGTPFEAIGGDTQAGLVTILMNATSSPSARLSFAPPQHKDQAGFGAGGVEAGDLFGAELAGGDFNGDGFGDIAIGIPDEQAGRRTERPGYIWIAYGGPGGLGRGHHVSQTPLSDNSDQDNFGASFVAVDLDGNGTDELVVGAPSNDSRDGVRSGNVMIFRTPQPEMSAWYSIDQNR